VSTGDVVLVLGLALGGGALSGALGWLALRVTRGRSLQVALAIATVSAVLAVVASTAAVARAMFLSAHDLGVVLLVCAVSAVVALVLGMLLGQVVVADARTVRSAAESLSDDADQPRGRLPRPPVTAELASIGREIEAASGRLAYGRRRERELEEARRQLVTWVSHDLRTPLAGLRAMAEALEDGVVDDPPRYHRQMRVEVERLTGMVDDLFELSRVHAGSHALRRERVSLEELVSDTLDAAHAVAGARGVVLSGEAMSAPTVEGDAAELARALRNLLVNAIRHTPADGTVRVRAIAHADHAVITVEDRCGGIPEPDLPKVFDVAWRGTHARTPGPDNGAGLGLAIVRAIVEAHGGSVSVANALPGCRFELRLPAG
jgi:signal transduction histidine kinase